MDRKGATQLIPLIMACAGLIFTLSSILVAFVWIDGGFKCIEREGPTPECIVWFLMNSPPVQTAMNIAEACNSSVENCTLEIGKEVIKDKITNYETPKGQKTDSSKK